MKIEDLKEIIFDLFDEYEEYEDIKDALRSLHSSRVITDDEYNYIIANYEDLLEDWEIKNDLIKG